MTLVYDIATGALLGQACHEPDAGTVRILTRDGSYLTLPATSVRLEVLP